MTANAAPEREFRLDINGLRAWAVIAVVLYHFGVAGIGGGFAGVDVFFVISGYLMCGIVLEGLERGDFSLWRFYLARARRIWPALVVLCAVVLAVGWFFLMPEEYRRLGKHVRESLTFSSNLRYFDESGYFDVASQEKWLLHTWSLSVEWQFYLLLPLLMMAMARWLPGRRRLAWVLGTLGVASLGLCLWRTQVDASEAFFLLQNRAWEMLAGALVYLAGRRNWSQGWQRGIELLGFGLILATILLFDRHSVWPGWRAVLPVAGAALVLLAARRESLWTGTPAVQWLGSRSYSIYLWHWPLVVALDYLERLRDPLWGAVAVCASLLFGHLSFRFVETPARRQLTRLNGWGSAVVLILTLALLSVLAQQVRKNGFPERLPEAVAKIEAERSNTNPRRDECLDADAHCIYGAEPVRVILLGDSHADALVTALQAALPEGRGGVLFRGESGCPIVFGLRSNEGKSEECEALNAQLERESARLPAGVPVVVVGRTANYLNGGQPGDKRPNFNFGTPYEEIDAHYLREFREHYVATMCRLAEQRPLYLVRPTPEMPADVPTRLGRAMIFGQERRFVLPLADYHRRQSFVWAMQDEVVERCGARLLDPLPYLCVDGLCPGEQNGRPLYRDDNHITEFGNRRLIPMFRQIFEAEERNGIAASRAEQPRG